MVNIIGSSRKVNNAAVKFDLGLLKNESGSRLYWYDKVGRVENRKLGHINVNARNSKKAIQIAERIRKAIKI
jgi:phosphoribosylaminoimidazole carboxylase (NCAIR synthetase)